MVGDLVKSAKSWKREVALLSLIYNFIIYGWAIFADSQMAFDVGHALMPFVTALVGGAYGLEGWTVMRERLGK